MTDKRAFEALLDEYARQHALATAPPISGVFTTTEAYDEARAAVLAAYEEAAGREGQPPAVAPVAEFNKAGGDLVADELVQSAYSWFREGWHARHAYAHPAPKAAAFDDMVKKGRAAWADVPNATAWVESQRGNVPPKADAAADWVLVPREPTPEMITAGRQELGLAIDACDFAVCAQRTYAAMIQASPARVGEGEK